MTPDISRVLVLGGYDSGKTTLLVQLHGRIKAGTGRLRPQGAPASLVPIEDGLHRLEQGLKVKHTGRSTQVELTVPAVTRSGRSVDITVPDYAGEDLGALIGDRRIDERWRRRAAESEDWLLLVRLALHPQLPDILTRPIGELAQDSPDDADVTLDDLPIDLWAVELLQALLHARATAGAARLPRLTLVLSCWDELPGAARDQTPPVVASNQLALLDRFCRNTWPSRVYRVVGLSAQGRELDDEHPADDFVDLGPHQMGWLVAEDGSRDPDLTLLVDR